jgi:hypothetical protein
MLPASPNLMLPACGIRSVAQAEEQMQRMLKMISDLDALLATQSHMLLGRYAIK